MTDFDSTGQKDLYEDFLELFTKNQFRISSYINALIHDRENANDVFQETALALWQSFASFRPEAEFVPWALGIARNQSLKHWRSQSRDRLVFSEILINQLSQDAIPFSEEALSREEALKVCEKKLAERHRELIYRFYGNNESAGEIAKSWDRTVHAVYKSLKVIRRKLMDCVEQQLALEK